MSSSTIFHGRSSRAPHPSSVPPIPQPAAHKIRPTLAWTEEEDQYLCHLVSIYPFNWPLITDSFNSEMITIPTEIRNAYECWERWFYSFGPGKGTKGDPNLLAPPNATNANSNNSAMVILPPPGSSLVLPPSSAVPSSDGPDTASTANGAPLHTAVNRQPIPQSATGPAGASSQSQPNSAVPIEGQGQGRGEAPPPPGLSKREAKAAARNKYEGSKKAIRHQVIYDSVRRLIRRREGLKQKDSE